MRNRTPGLEVVGVGVAAEMLGLDGTLGSSGLLEDGESPGTTTNVAVGSAHVAVVVGERLALTVREGVAAYKGPVSNQGMIEMNRRRTPALASVLNTGHGEALAGASVDAKSVGHAIRGEHVAVESAVVSIGSAANGGPTRGDGRAGGASRGGGSSRSGGGGRSDLLEEADSPGSTAFLAVSGAGHVALLSRVDVLAVVDGVAAYDARIS